MPELVAIDWFEAGGEELVSQRCAESAAFVFDVREGFTLLTHTSESRPGNSEVECVQSCLDEGCRALAWDTVNSRHLKRFCPATSPASPQTSGLDAAIRELIESTTVPDCVKNAFTRIVEEFSLVPTSPASPQTSGLDAAIRELIESTTVPDCVKNAFTRIVEEFSLAHHYLLFPMLRLLAIPISSIHSHLNLHPVVASPIPTRLVRSRRDEDR
ncbi:unnamed protein product [Heligmosomoides polygyrus]|uniref:Apple domain-containing protein n=1 Tax=Heligmosomoides polygyrus TaxID=6339 RepID=A0A183GRE0_HELPZ|nr:unnamed protein product [Heligmosomoides polygyrus]